MCARSGKQQLEETLSPEMPPMKPRTVDSTVVTEKSLLSPPNAPKSHFVKIVLKNRVSVTVKIIIGFQKKKRKLTISIFIRHIAGYSRKEGERRGCKGGGGGRGEAKRNILENK